MVLYILLHILFILFVQNLNKCVKNEHSQNEVEFKLPQISPEIMRIASERHQKGLMSPWVYQLLSQVNITGTFFLLLLLYFPFSSLLPLILRIDCENICLFQGEVKLEVCLEEDVSRDLISYVELYRPVRQTLYSVLFNLNKLKIIHENQSKDKGKLYLNFYHVLHTPPLYFKQCSIIHNFINK